MNRYSLILMLTVLSAVSLLIALSTGSVGTPAAVWNSLTGTGDATLREIVLDLRLPRALAAFGTGAALALAGAMMQVLLRNPLADPYILGTSGGAAVTALIGIMLGATGFFIDALAFTGALGSTLLVFTLAQSRTERSSGRLLLTGVVTAAGWGAAISLLLALAPERALRGMLFWLMGDFSFAGNPASVLTIAFLAMVIGMLLAPTLNLLATGERQAALLGVEVQPVRSGLYFLSSLLTAVAVTTAGTVGFVGLVIPHLIRLVGDADHRTVMPCSALAGGCLLVIADTLARSAVAPVQLPVGAITAVLGVPLFLVLLRRTGSDRH